MLMWERSRASGIQNGSKYHAPIPLNERRNKMKSWQTIAVGCFISLISFQGMGHAQAKYPSRPIELVIPMAPGGSADITARLYTEDLSKDLKVPVNIVNRAGGAGIQGTSYVARAKKDGYTLLQGSATYLVVMPIISIEATYDPIKDFIPLGFFVSVPSIFDVRSDSPFKNLHDLIEYARKNPGKLKNGAGGLGTVSYFNLEVLCAKNNITITTIPFKSGGEALPAILGGHVDMVAGTLTTEAPQIKAGKLRGLAITSKTRHPDFPEIPTTAELGYPYVNLSTWQGVFAPAGTPLAVVNTLVPTLERIFKNPEIVQRALKAGYVPDYKGPEEFRKFIESEIAAVEKIAKDIKMIKQ